MLRIAQASCRTGFILLCAFSFACASPPGSGTHGVHSDVDAGEVSADTGGSGGGEADGGGSSTLTGGDAGGGATGGSEGGSVGTCDLVGDGGCACLRLATVGFRGQWGTGDVFGNWIQQKALLGVDSLGAQELTPEVLNRYQVIIVQDVREGTAGQSGVGNGLGRAFSQSEVTAVQQWVMNGGGMATLLGYADSTENVNVNRLLEPFGLQYGSDQILQGGHSSTVPGGWDTARVTHWADHPIANGITIVGVDSGYPVLGGGTLVAWEPLQDQWPVARAVESGSGRVFSWSDEWITYDFEWTEHPDFQVQRFWLNILRWLTPLNQCEVISGPN